MDDVFERKHLIVAEYQVLIPDTMPVREFLWMSDKASARREERRKAISEGKTWHG